MSQLPKPEDYRHADHPIEPILLRRWSPRAMNGEGITDEQMLTLFEAARWAPSSFNEQEWRFLYARCDTPQWPLFFSLLDGGNQVWCKEAAMLVVIVAHKVFALNGRPNPVHLFDVGSAWQNLALQASAMGLVAHAMQGFDFAKAHASLSVPDDYAVAAMFAIGNPGDPSALREGLRAMEVPSLRRPAKESICEGAFVF